jgi:1,2-diacylglycerol 3-beta-glucosyltransferase
VVVALSLWTVALYLRGQRAILRAREPSPTEADEWTWVFLVPALNEEVTIADSVERLVGLPLARRLIVVIDDASDDRTPAILGRLAHPDLHVLRRDLPDARRGKAAALNAAYRMLGGLLDGVDRQRVIVVVVDADGRITPAAPGFAAVHFRDPRVGGVQALVRIYNRGSFLTRMQELEFAVYGRVYQAGRNAAGTAGMGGNGQFNRLAALDAIAVGGGPWRDRLTEDQDLGLRLLGAGWRSHQEVRAEVHQQGVSRLRPLLRQRTRWSQGNLQAFDLASAIWRSPLPRLVRIEELAYLLMPIWQGIVGVSVIVAGVLAALGAAPIVPAPEQIPIVYVLAFGNTTLGCLASRAAGGARSWLRALVLGHVYAVYTWILFPVLARSTARQLAARRDWARTDREPLRSSAAAGPS